MLRHFLASAVATALLSAALSAQVALSVDPGVLNVGKTAKVTYSNPALAGQTIEVVIDNGSRREPQSDRLSVTLDANGNGSAHWLVPNWYGAKFNAPNAAEVFCPVLP